MRLLQLSLTVALLSLPTNWLQASVSSHGVHCPRCHEPCHAMVEKAMETKHCWDVQLKPICIPRITFPWQRHCGKDGCPSPAQGGRIKYVKILVKHEYQCATCKYTWTPDSRKGISKAMQPPSARADSDSATRQFRETLRYGNSPRFPVILE